MSSSEDAKEFLSYRYTTVPSDWKRISKRKHNNSEIRVFEDKKNNRQVELINLKGDDDFFTIERIPTKFWIYLPDETYNQLQNGTLTDEYTSTCEVDDDDWATGYRDPVIVVFQESESTDENEVRWHDQHVSGIMMDYYGIDFCYDEQCENKNVLVTPKSLKEVKEMFTSKGLKFLGYKEMGDNF